MISVDINFYVFCVFEMVLEGLDRIASRDEWGTEQKRCSADPSFRQNLHRTVICSPIHIFLALLHLYRSIEVTFSILIDLI